MDEGHGRSIGIGSRSRSGMETSPTFSKDADPGNLEK